MALHKEQAVFARMRRMPAGRENMSPANPFIRTLATIPVAIEELRRIATGS